VNKSAKVVLITARKAVRPTTLARVGCARCSWRRGEPG
jgi:hypothetical protein